MTLELKKFNMRDITFKPDENKGPVVVLIGDDGTAHGGENIYGDRDMNHLESRLKEWLPILKNESEGLSILINSSTDSHQPRVTL